MACTEISDDTVRRAACDRCRKQKLRCVRLDDGESSICQRCTSAKAICEYGVPKPVGRPQGSRKRKAAEIAIEVPISPSPSDPERHRLRSLDESDEVVQNYFEEHMDIKESLPALDSGNDSLFPGWDSIWPVGQPNTPTLSVMDNPQNLLRLNEMAAPLEWHKDSLISQTQGFPLTPMPSDSGLIDASAFSISDASSDPKLHALPSVEDPCDFLVEKKFDARGAKQIKRSQSSPQGLRSAQQSRMQLLSDLTMSLFRLLDDSHHLQQQVRESGALPTFPTQFAGKLIEVSNSFLDLLQAFSPAVAPNDDEDDEEDEDSEQEMVRFHHVSYSAIPYTPPSDISDGEVSPTTSPSTKRRKLSKPRALGKRPVTDTITILQILANYLRLRSLHSLLYSAIQLHLEQRSADSTNAEWSRTARNISLFPDLHIGGASLEQFSNFHIKLVLQVGAHLLGECERTLGLPDKHRIGERNSNKEAGLLETSISVELLEMTLRDSDDGDSLGDFNSPTAIRDLLAKLKVMLRGSINI